MMRYMLKSKIHRATITGANLNYEGSLTVARDIMDAVDMVPFEKINVYNIHNGERFETYVIEGEPGSGVIALNGAAARKGIVGDLIIIVTYCLVDDAVLTGFKPRVALMDSDNRIRKVS